MGGIGPGQLRVPNQCLAAVAERVAAAPYPNPRAFDAAQLLGPLE